MKKVVPIKVFRHRLLILDQRKLPQEMVWFEAQRAADVVYAIRHMLLRGAPLIGIAAAYGFYLEIYHEIKKGRIPTLAFAKRLKQSLDKSRPTAINLMWATELMLEAFRKLREKNKPGEIVNQLFAQAKFIQEDDAQRCAQMACEALVYLEKNLPRQKYRVLTHCNTGALATGGIGTALGLIRLLQQKGKLAMVYVGETRPYLQGARLTTWELFREKIPVTLVVDSMAAFLMQKAEVDVVVVGADRITRRGDVANKIGTYSLSVLAKHHQIPFLVLAPESTYDGRLTFGHEIPIEERDAHEVLSFHGLKVSPPVKVKNYSFDITPRENITAIITEKGLFQGEPAFSSARATSPSISIS
ncbi:MAG: S-methyl-5-thioribose-1-phosphate isomerase [Leptospiraceae bacterium]|nr:S-methyl-5-thioribose-1-phosphate isomerase [Leptospiraceae bacterium]MDW8307095.1 S-methyl-5-thioribose-1-phosphate isomerase [Leptospiraceae bacterium]